MQYSVCQAAGATAYDIQKTKANIAQLQSKLAAQQQKLQTTEQTPTLQELATKTRTELTQKGVDISGTFDRIKAEGSIITDGSHIKKGKLKPDVTYQAGEHEYLYQTDGKGRIRRAIAKGLKLKTPGKRKGHSRNTPDKRPTDEAGHLIADRFGGARKLDNLVSQAKNVNRKKFGDLEDIWAAAIDRGKDVSVDIQLFYEGDSSRPVAFRIDYTIGGIVARPVIFTNN